jgi:hypothetical protein
LSSGPHLPMHNELTTSLNGPYVVCLRLPSRRTLRLAPFSRCHLPRLAPASLATTMPLLEDDATNANGHSASHLNRYNAAVEKEYTPAKTNGWHTADTNGYNASATSGSSASATNGPNVAATNGHNAADTHGNHTTDRNGTHAADTNGHHTADVNGPDAESSQHTSRARFRKTTSSQQANGATVPRRSSASAIVDHQNLIPVVSSFNNKDNGFGSNDVQYRLPTGTQSKADLIRRFLLDIFIYTYDPSRHVLEQTLLHCRPSSRPDNRINGRLRFLSSDEWHIVGRYTENVHQACTNLTQSNISLLTRNNREFICNNILQPARDLDIDPAYVCEQLLSYRTHRCLLENRKKTRLYPKVSIWSRGRDLLGKKAQRLLACRLISDDVTVSLLGEYGREPITEMLGQCIREFNQKHCKHGMANVDRDVYADHLPTALAEEIYWNPLVKQWMRGPDEATFAPPFEDPYPPPPPQNAYLRRPRSSQSMRLFTGIQPLGSIYEQDERTKRPQSASGQRLRKNFYQQPGQAQSAEFAVYPTNDGAMGRGSMSAAYASTSLGRRPSIYRG